MSQRWFRVHIVLAFTLMFVGGLAGNAKLLVIMVDPSSAVYSPLQNILTAIFVLCLPGGTIYAMVLGEKSRKWSRQWSK